MRKVHSQRVPRSHGNTNEKCVSCKEWVTLYLKSLHSTSGALLRKNIQFGAAPVIARMSSKDAAATTMLGMPLRTPKPLFCRSNIPETTTAGDTAAKMKPRVRPKVNGLQVPDRCHNLPMTCGVQVESDQAYILNSHTAAPATTNASMIPGQAVNLIAAAPVVAKTFKSSSSPDLNCYSL